MLIHNWVIDPAHSEIEFKVRHLMISTVTGHFRKFSLNVRTEGDNFTTMQDLVLTIDTDSIDTNNKQRDQHLKSPDFFDSGQFNLMQFRGIAFEGSGTEGELRGNLTIRDVTKQVMVAVTFGGIVVDPYGQTKAGFTVEGKINRKEFGLTWSEVTEAGHIIVGDDVRFHGEIQLIRND